MKKLLICILLAVTASACAAPIWSDITKQFITNPSFTDNSSEGWNWDNKSNEVGAEIIRFFSRKFQINQQLTNIPKGKYRLSVQGFYRVGGSATAYYAHRNGTENITAYLYAGENSTKLTSIFSESLDYNANNRCYTPDNIHYYPDGKEPSATAFKSGLYNNSLEFETEGDITIGVRCLTNEESSYCALDNFKLEYYGEIVKAKSIAVSALSTELTEGETIEATAVILPTNTTFSTVNWSSDNEKVATVDPNGNITAVGSGSATITATSFDDSNTKGTLTINVSKNIVEPGSLIINEIMSANIDEYISPAFNFDAWVEIYNPTDKAISLSGLEFCDPANETNSWRAPQSIGTIPSKGYRLVWFGSNNGNANNIPFDLDMDGGTLIIRNSDASEIARQDYPAGKERISYARTTNGEWAYCGMPTPEKHNGTWGKTDKQLDAPIVDQPSQLFTSPISVNVTIPSGCSLRYTIDGTLPTPTHGQTSTTGKFYVTSTKNYRFRLFADGMLPSRVTTRSYIYKNKEYYLPVVSVVTDRNFLYSQEIGVMVTGPNGRPGNGQDSNCNWNMDWERPVNFSYIDAHGKMVLNQDVNLEMCGGWSRAWTPHSFKLKGEKEMGGDKNLVYPFFEQKPYIRNRTLQIRNGGNDTQCRFKDPALQYIVESSGMNIDCQSYQPVHEFINGEYIGVLNVREPNNKHYVYANYGWSDDQIDQFEMSPDSGYIQKCGTPDAFNNLLDLSGNAADNNTYQEICQLLDIDAYANYMAIEMYLGGTDWPQNNIKGFRYRDGGKFRFVLFDLDGTFATQDPFSIFMEKETHLFDQLRPASLGRYTKPIQFVTLFKNLLKNADFRRKFIDTYCIVGGSIFEKKRSSQIVSDLLNRVEPAMNLKSNGWGYESATGTANQLKYELNNRLTTAINALKNFRMFGLYNITPQNIILKSTLEGAKIYINDQNVPTGQFNGRLFAPIKIKAEGPTGSTFRGWRDNQGDIVYYDREITLPTSGSINLTAVFEPGINSTAISINEVSGANDSYIDEYGKKGDWVELFNNTDLVQDVEGMFLTDDLNQPEKCKITKGSTNANTKIPAHGHLVIWCDNKRATTDNGLHANFKIDADGGVLQLTSGDKKWKDLLSYGAHDSSTTIGRYPDGAKEVYTLNVATIGKSNIKTSYMEKVDQSGSQTVGIRTPSSAANGLRICYGSGTLLVNSENSQKMTIDIYRADGQQVEHCVISVKDGVARFAVPSLLKGFYMAHAIDDNGTVVSCKFTK